VQAGEQIGRLEAPGPLRRRITWSRGDILGGVCQHTVTCALSISSKQTEVYFDIVGAVMRPSVSDAFQKGHAAVKFAS